MSKRLEEPYIVKLNRLNSSIDFNNLKAGYIGMVFKDEEGKEYFEVRKPTPLERVSIVLNYIKDHPGRIVRISFFAKKLHVSERTIQNILSPYVRYGFIIAIPTFNKQGKQRGNKYYWKANNLHSRHLKVRIRPTLEKLYDKDNPYGFRNWHWIDFKFVEGYTNKIYSKEDIKEAIEYEKELKEELKRIKDEQKGKPILEKIEIKPRNRKTK